VFVFSLAERFDTHIQWTAATDLPTDGIKAGTLPATGYAMLRTSAKWIAGRDSLPTSMRAVMGYYADTGEFDAGSLQLKRRVDDVTDAILDEAFAAVETAVAAEFDRDAIDFQYDTKLVLPAQLTLGYLYRRVDEDDHADVEAVTRLAIEALVDGDMRDAINDDEFEDFSVDFPTDDSDRRRIAELAQATLEDRVDAGFADYPEEVREVYDWAVDVSEAHQDDDEYFRRLMAAATGDGGPGETAADAGGPDSASAGGTAGLAPVEARERIREEYKFAGFEDPPEVFAPGELDLPYLKTQYDRVGVIYDGMIGMYRAAGFPVEDAFTRSIVLAIIGAQVWLDDVDDYRADMREGQLTPVTAEYVLSDSESAAYESTVEVSEQYLDLAKEHARSVDSTLTGIAAEYIYRSGNPGRLPRG
jgi:hypothetical protein